MCDYSDLDDRLESIARVIRYIAWLCIILVAGFLGYIIGTFQCDRARIEGYDEGYEDGKLSIDYNSIRIEDNANP